MRKALWAALAICFVGMLGAQSVLAFSLGGYEGGPVVFSLKDWTYGRAYSWNATQQKWDPTGDTHGWLTASTNMIPDGGYVNGDGIEDTWGVVRVDAITDPNGDPLWQEGSSGEYITGWIYGFDDVYIKTNVDNTYTVQQVGGTFELYIDTVNDFGDDITANPITYGSRAAYLTDFIDGNQFLKFDAVGGIVSAQTPNGTAITKNETTSGFTSPFTGQTAFYADVDQSFGYGNQWVLNYLPVDEDGDGTIELGEYASLFAQIQFNQNGKNYFDAKSSDLNDSAVVPEPATMLLFGSGLIGLAGWGRRKFGKKV